MTCVILLLSNCILELINDIFNLINIDITKVVYHIYLNSLDIKLIEYHIKKQHIKTNNDKLDFILDKLDGLYNGYKMAILIENKHKKQKNNLLIKLLIRNLYIRCLSNIATF